MKKFLLRLLYIPQVLLLLVFCVIRFIPSISPAEYEIIGVLGLMTPVLSFVNITFLVLWILIRKYTWAGIAAIGMIISWNVLSVCFGFNFLKKITLLKEQMSLRL